VKIHHIAAVASAVIASSTLLPTAGHATLIDFNELKKPSGETYVYGAYTDPTGDYQLSADRCSSSNTCFITTVNNGRRNIDFDAGQTGLTNFLGSAVATLSRLDGEAFTLDTIDFAYNYGNQSGYGPTEVGLLFTFTFADGSDPLSETIFIPNTAGEWLTKTSLDFSGYGPLAAFSWKPTTSTSGFIQFDNINVDLAVPAAVPEPASWAMLTLGFGLLGGALRSGKRAGRVTFA